MFLTMAVVAAPVAVLTARGASDVGAVLEAPGAFGLLVTITLLPTLGSFVLMNAFQRRVTASEAGVMYATEPVFASAFALFLPAVMSRLLQIEYPNEGLDSRLFVGGALVVVANLLLALRPAEPARPGPTAENHTRKN
jgi:drug/metabolite transporter (DMT)-like permease